MTTNQTRATHGREQRQGNRAISSRRMAAVTSKFHVPGCFVRFTLCRLPYLPPSAATDQVTDRCRYGCAMSPVRRCAPPIIETVPRADPVGYPTVTMLSTIATDPGDWCTHRRCRHPLMTL